MSTQGKGYITAVLVILGVEERKVLACREKLIKREGEGGREWQPMHGEIMIQDQTDKAAVAWLEG